MRHRVLVRLAGAATVLAVLSGSACTDPGVPRRAPSAPVRSPTTPVNATTGPATPAAYQADGLDLCQRVGLDPRADLKLTVRGSDPTPLPTGPGAACLFELRTAQGRR